MEVFAKMYGDIGWYQIKFATNSTVIWWLKKEKMF